MLGTQPPHSSAEMGNGHCCKARIIQHRAGQCFREGGGAQQILERRGSHSRIPDQSLERNKSITRWCCSPLLQLLTLQSCDSACVGQPILAHLICSPPRNTTSLAGAKQAPSVVIPVLWQPPPLWRRCWVMKPSNSQSYLRLGKPGSSPSTLPSHLLREQVQLGNSLINSPLMRLTPTNSSLAK